VTVSDILVVAKALVGLDWGREIARGAPWVSSGLGQEVSCVWCTCVSFLPVQVFQAHGAPETIPSSALPSTTLLHRITPCYFALPSSISISPNQKLRVHCFRPSTRFFYRYLPYKNPSLFFRNSPDSAFDLNGIPTTLVRPIRRCKSRIALHVTSLRLLRLLDSVWQDVSTMGILCNDFQLNSIPWLEIGGPKYVHEICSYGRSSPKLSESSFFGRTIMRYPIREAIRPLDACPFGQCQTIAIIDTRMTFVII